MKGEGGQFHRDDSNPVYTPIYRSCHYSLDLYRSPHTLCPRRLRRRSFLMEEIQFLLDLASRLDLVADATERRN